MDQFTSVFIPIIAPYLRCGFLSQAESASSPAEGSSAVVEAEYNIAELEPQSSNGCR